MTDPRLTVLADRLVNYAVRLKKGEKVLIETHNVDAACINEIIKAVYAVGAHPYVVRRDTRVERQMLLGATKEQFEFLAQADTYRMSLMDAFIGIRGFDNLVEQCDVPDEIIQMNSRYYATPVHHDIRVAKTKWVVLRYPTSAFAQASGMSTEAFEDFYFNVCNLDYGKMDKAMDPLKALMERTDKVRIVAKDTDLTFSIKGIPAVKCAGNMNIPDGEIYTAPVRDSINGRITYNIPSIENGYKYENVSLLFKNGKIIEATANNTEGVNAIFDTDEGARYVGEFAIGVNPYVTKGMGDILFDEKISGSIHFTPGNCYEDAPNGNKSAIHWDLVLVQTPEYGGGEIWFDDVLIRKDGRFVLPELECLNPENLI
ncbi:MAG: aminopeptidase [Clostridia bacterium]|nr:aminopeptidase [Clostridia bacterium]